MQKTTDEYWRKATHGARSLNVVRHIAELIDEWENGEGPFYWEGEECSSDHWLSMSIEDHMDRWHMKKDGATWQYVDYNAYE